MPRPYRSGLAMTTGNIPTLPDILRYAQDDREANEVMMIYPGVWVGSL